MHSVALTVGDVLQLDPLRSAEPTVVAGAAHLGRTVRWVHVAELPEIGHLLQGGELILTTGLGIADDASTQQRFVADLADAGAAGVVVELGRTFRTVPEAMADVADSRGLPLVSLGKETRFVEVTEVVHREVLRRQYELLDRAERTSRELAGQILEGAEVGEIVAHLSRILGAEVVFEDAEHRVVAASAPDDPSGPGAGWERHAALPHAAPSGEDDRLGAVHRVSGVPGCAWVDLWIRHDRWGRLHVLSHTQDVDELLVDRAGAALALAMLSEKDAAHLAERACDALIGEIVAGRAGSGADVLRRARGLGADLGTGRLVAVVLEARWGEPSGTVSDDERVETLRALASGLRTEASARRCGALVGTSGDRVVAVLAVPGTRRLSGVVDELVGAAAERELGRRAGAEVVAGASAQALPDTLTAAIGDAAVAAEFAARAAGTRRVHHFAELGTYQLLLRLADGPELARFVDAELRPLLEQDSAGRARLVPTLRAYLLHGGRKAGAARELGIQRRTLYQRLARVESLLARDLDDQATRTRLTLALQGLDLLSASVRQARSRPGAVRSPAAQ